jgi:hypothetical protein
MQLEVAESRGGGIGLGGHQEPKSLSVPLEVDDTSALVVSPHFFIGTRSRAQVDDGIGRSVATGVPRDQGIAVADDPHALDVEIGVG